MRRIGVRRLVFCQWRVVAEWHLGGERQGVAVAVLVSHGQLRAETVRAIGRGCCRAPRADPTAKGLSVNGRGHSSVLALDHCRDQH